MCTARCTGTAHSTKVPPSNYLRFWLWWFRCHCEMMYNCFKYLYAEKHTPSYRHCREGKRQNKIRFILPLYLKLDLHLNQIPCEVFFSDNRPSCLKLLQVWPEREPLRWLHQVLHQLECSSCRSTSSVKVLKTKYCGQISPTPLKLSTELLKSRL